METRELLEQAKAKREAGRILVHVGREMLRAADQERLIGRGHQLEREAVNLEVLAAR